MQTDFSIIGNLFAFMKMPESPLNQQQEEMMMSSKQSMNLEMPDLAVCSVATSTQGLWAGEDSRADRLSGYLADLAGTLATWKLRHKTRQQLARTDPEYLRDVGISEAQRFVEVNKPFWKA